MEYQALYSIVKEAGKLMLSADNIQATVTEKGQACDLVTAYDKAVQDFLCSSLKEAYPTFGIYAEEDDLCDFAQGTYFIIDPIDGTTNFVRELHHSCISVGLCQNDEIIAAAVYNPFVGELFTAEKGKGSYLNGKRLHVTEADLSNSLVLVGSAIYYRDTVPATLRFIEELFPVVLDFRRGGSAALDLCYVAAGKADLFFECCLRPWDYAAGSLIVTEAGGTVSALDGTPLRFFDRCSVAAGNPKNYPALMELSHRIAQEPGMKGRIK